MLTFLDHMTTKQIPRKLGKEPLIDVICGIRFESDIPVDALLPGLLLSKLINKTPKFERFPAAQLPQVIRDGNPDLQNAPLMRVLVDDQFAILIGSHWLGVGCIMPYAGWSIYKPMIEQFFSVLENIPSIKMVNRLSMKYVDFIENSSPDEPFSRVKLQIDIAGRKILNQVTQLRTEIAESPFIHAITIVSHATAVCPDNSKKDGVVVDVDTHRIENFSLQEFLTQMPDLLDGIHAANKTFFFELLSESGLQALEPIYE